MVICLNFCRTLFIWSVLKTRNWSETPYRIYHYHNCYHIYIPGFGKAFKEKTKRKDIIKIYNTKKSEVLNFGLFLCLNMIFLRCQHRNIERQYIVLLLYLTQGWSLELCLKLILVFNRSFVPCWTRSIWSSKIALKTYKFNGFCLVLRRLIEFRIGIWNFFIGFFRESRLPFIYFIGVHF